MTTELLQLTLDFLVSLEEPSYTEGLSQEQIMDKAMQELNTMTRCEYLIVFGDTMAMKDFHEKQKLERGETITREYTVTVVKEQPSTDSDPA